MALLKCWFNSFCYQKNWAEFLKMSLLIKNYPAVGTERNPCSGAACTKLLHTHTTALLRTPRAMQEQCNMLEGPAHNSRTGVWWQGSRTAPQNKSQADVPQVGVHLQRPFTLRAPRTQPHANTTVPQGNTSIYTVLILTTVNSKEIQLEYFFKWELPLDIPTTDLPPACS